MWRGVGLWALGSFENGGGEGLEVSRLMEKQAHTREIMASEP